MYENFKGMNMTNATDNSDMHAWTLCFMNFDGEVTILDSSDYPEQMFYYVEKEKKMVDLKQFVFRSKEYVVEHGGYTSGLYIIPGCKNECPSFYFRDYFDIFNMKKLFKKVGMEGPVKVVVNTIPSYAIRIKGDKNASQ